MASRIVISLIIAIFCLYGVHCAGLFGWPMALNDAKECHVHENPMAMTLDANTHLNKRAVAITHLYPAICPFDDMREGPKEYAQWLNLSWNEGFLSVVNLMMFNCNNHSDSRWMVPAIANGRYNATLHKHARFIANWLHGPDGVWDTNDDRRIYLAPMHEMNGNTFPWANQTPGHYIKAFQTIVSIFRSALPGGNVTKHRKNVIQFIFCVIGGDNPQIEQYYPGNEFVDWLALDAYNFAGSIGWKWRTPFETYNPTVLKLRELNKHKPLAVLETGTTSEITTMKYPNKTYTTRRDIESKNGWVERAFKYFTNPKHAFSMVLWQNINIELKKGKAGRDWPVFTFCPNVEETVALVGKNHTKYYVTESWANAMKSDYWVATHDSVPPWTGGHKRIVHDKVFRGLE